VAATNEVCGVLISARRGFFALPRDWCLTSSDALHGQHRGPRRTGGRAPSPPRSPLSSWQAIRRAWQPFKASAPQAAPLERDRAQSLLALTRGQDRRFRDRDKAVPPPAPGPLAAGGFLSGPSALHPRRQAGAATPDAGSVGQRAPRAGCRLSDASHLTQYLSPGACRQAPAIGPHLP
jgi:hypothetical protein